MKYIVNLVDARGKNKVKYVEGKDIKDAQSNVESMYPSFEVTRITPDKSQIDYYKTIKDIRKEL
tara:strand:+ start:1386 stop:1577 length:192 start_codon:yes stop_codon:yes gene_type:complete